MKILLIQDEGVNIDLEKSTTLLNDLCGTIKCESYNIPIRLDSESTFINLKKEIEILNQKTSSIKRDYTLYYTLYLTFRRYVDNYFAHSAKNIMIWSFWGWKYYTNLPLENGLFYIIADILALKLDRSFRHDEITGCIYDFLWNKTGIDMGMKMAHICEGCLTRVKDKLKDKKSLGILSDLIKILDLLSNSSRWGKSVFEVENDTNLAILDWSTFEDEVAQIYRELGASVKQNVKLAGFQIDIYLEEETPSGQKIRSVVECKFNRKTKVGNRTANEFYRVMKTLKDAGLVDKGIIVSYSGFSDDAHLASKTTGIELLLFKDLQQRVKFPKKKVAKSAESIIKEKRAQIKERKAKSPDIFVIMPFSPDFDDVYYLGIREIAEKLNLSCKRVDEMEFVGDILDEIYNSITNARIIIAEATSPNPNVYYELGYAHALGKPVILLTKDVSSTPFDLKMYNHIVYKNIRELRQKLEKRLGVII